MVSPSFKLWVGSNSVGASVCCYEFFVIWWYTLVLQYSSDFKMKLIIMQTNLVAVKSEEKIKLKNTTSSQLKKL